MVKIGHGAFSNSKIKQIRIPAGIEEIGDCAFRQCKNLTTVTFTLGSYLKKIGHYAFSECKIMSITLPDGLTNIGHGVFFNSGIREIYIPAGVDKIEGS